MSVAQVLRVSGITPGTLGMVAALKALDGFEHIYVLSNGDEEGDGESLCIQVWRDRAALEAKGEQMTRSGVDDQVASMGIKITAEEVYEVFTEL